MKEGLEIEQYRYTVHNSESSKAGVNAVNFHRRFKNKEVYTLRSFTPVIKSGVGFCPLFFRLCPMLDCPEFALRKTKGKKFYLSLCEPGFTLAYMVAVAGLKNRFPNVKAEDFQARNLVFRKARLVVLWSYLFIPTQISHWIHHLPGDDLGVTESFKAHSLIRYYRIILKGLKSFRMEDMRRYDPFVFTGDDVDLSFPWLSHGTAETWKARINAERARKAKAKI